MNRPSETPLRLEAPTVSFIINRRSSSSLHEDKEKSERETHTRIPRILLLQKPLDRTDER